MASTVSGKIRAYRVLEGLASSGYTPASAICDIVDNSVSYGASNIWIRLDRNPTLAENRLNNATQYVIEDDGNGMTKDELLNALSLGSSDVYPASDSLSKFGLGLKSAAFSQGRRLTVCTRSAGSPLFRASVDLDIIREADEYIFDLEEVADASESEYLEKLRTADSHGTVVLIDQMRHVNQPSTKKTRSELRRDIGTTYQFFMQRDSAINFFVHDGVQVDDGYSKIDPFDPLAIAEAVHSEASWEDETSPITRGDWNGQTVEWLQKPTEIVLDPETNVKALLEVTQLPHPPTFGDDRTKVRNKYGIEAGAYGVYVYRHDRLISFADRFDGLIPQDQEFFSFRARLRIDASADEALNIDLKKSRILLSDAARNALDDFLAEPKRQSKAAWNSAALRLKQLANEDPESLVSDQLSGVELPDDLPTDSATETDSEERQRREDDDRRKRPARRDEDHADTPGTPQRPAGGRVIFVPALDDNVVYERAYDPELGPVVRVNSGHRFVREARQRFSGPGATFIFQSILLSLVNAEVHTIRAIGNDAEAVLEDLRISFSSTIGQIAREIASKIDD